MKTQLTRSTTNKVLGGVCGGIADAFGWDPVLVRVGFVVLALAHGIALPLYLILFFVMPKAGEPSAMQQTVAGVQGAAYSLRSSGRDQTLGFVLLGLGALMLAGMLDITGPVIALAILGAGIYLMRKR